MPSHLGMALLAILVWGAYPPLMWAADNEVSCRSQAGRVFCEMDIRQWIQSEIRAVLNNGWENTLQIDLLLFDQRDNLTAVTYAEVSQRCYIDPFDNPCLVLWQGSKQWQTYDNVDAMVQGLGRFTLASVATSDLPEGSYSVRLDLKLNPITDEQANVIRKWLGRSRGGHMVIGRNESSIFGTFVTVFANIRSGHAEAVLQVSSPPFTLP